MDHDELCRGCARQRRAVANGFDERAPARMPGYVDYKTECSKCGKQIPGEYEHFVRGKIYCADCVPA